MHTYTVLLYHIPGNNSTKIYVINVKIPKNFADPIIERYEKLPPETGGSGNIHFELIEPIKPILYQLSIRALASSIATLIAPSFVSRSVTNDSAPVRYG